MQRVIKFGAINENVAEVISGKVSEKAKRIIEKTTPTESIEQDPVVVQYSDRKLNNAQKAERKRQEAKRAKKIEEKIDSVM